MTSGAADKEPPKPPERVSIKLVAREKPKVSPAKPEPPKRVPPKPTPKAMPIERPKPVAVVPRPTPSRPVTKPTQSAEPPKAQSKPRESRPVTRPNTEKAPVTGGRPAASTKRLSGSSQKPTGRKSPVVPVPPAGDPGGQAGVLPPTEKERSAPVGDGLGEPGADDVVGSAQGQPKAEPAAPPPEAERKPEPPAAPKEEPPALPPEQEKPPSRDSGASAPKMREASIEVPEIRLPARLRREALKTSLRVRVAIEANGQADFKLAESSGNQEVDDYVLEQLRNVAVVTPALDAEGRPKKVVRPMRVDIKVD